MCIRDRHTILEETKYANSIVFDKTGKCIKYLSHTVLNSEGYRYNKDFEHKTHYYEKFETVNENEPMIEGPMICTTLANKTVDINYLHQFTNVYFAFPAFSKTLVEIPVRETSDGNWAGGLFWTVMVPPEFSSSQLKFYLRFLFNKGSITLSNIVHERVRLSTARGYRRAHATFPSLEEVLKHRRNTSENVMRFVFSKVYDEECQYYT